MDQPNSLKNIYNTGQFSLREEDSCLTCCSQNQFSSATDASPLLLAEKRQLSLGLQKE